ncbi:MAG TPA: long-chain-fatty-acid--CoA ligase [Ktedonobacterales bacterium]|nr:long-chain-fatty-acid--CoA ligase [Ktedonobacterales bacterium]
MSSSSPTPDVTTATAPLPSVPRVPATTGSAGVVTRDMLRRAERLFPHKTAVVCGEHRLTYREYGRRARKVAGALRALGIGKGDRVAALMLNCHRYLELYAGCFELGAIIVPLNVRLAPPEIIYTVNDAGALALFVDETLRPLAQAAQPGLTTVRTYVHASVSGAATPAGMRDYDELVAAAEELVAAPEVDESDVAGLFYTSGTTGNPKGVMLTNRNICANALHISGQFAPSSHDVVLHAVPMFHLSGGPTAWLYFWVGATHVVQRMFEPVGTFALVARERVTRVTWAPTMLTMLLAHPAVHTADFSSLELIAYGASPIAPDRLKEALRVFGCRFVQAYGMTEVAPILTLLLPEEHEPEGDARAVRRLLSCGREVPGVSVRVVNEQGEDAAPGEVGEIIARGANVMLGYWRKPAESAAALRDGWYYSGDLGTLDEDGYLYVVDRKKDMIISGGENIYSTEVEAALYSHPAVLEAAAIGVPDDQWGEVVKAIVALRPGMTATPEELIAHCRTLIAGYKCPRSVDFLETLPKSGSNKILKRELREPYWQGHARRVN